VPLRTWKLLALRIWQELPLREAAITMSTFDPFQGRQHRHRLLGRPRPRT
jgi:hypothetical protein